MKTLILASIFVSASSFAITVETQGYLVKRGQRETYKGISRDGFIQELSMDAFSASQKNLMYECAKTDETTAIEVNTHEDHEIRPTGRPNSNELVSKTIVDKVECVVVDKKFRKRWSKVFGGAFNIF